MLQASAVAELKNKHCCNIASFFSFQNYFWGKITLSDLPLKIDII
jgi:hypothetical protein